MTEVVKEEPKAPVPPASFGDSSITVQCPNCGQTVQTVCDYKNGACVYLSCGLIAVAGGILGCCLIPFCVKSCKDVDHECPNCKYHLGYFKRL